MLRGCKNILVLLYGAFLQTSGKKEKEKMNRILVFSRSSFLSEQIWADTFTRSWGLASQAAVPGPEAALGPPSGSACSWGRLPSSLGVGMAALGLAGHLLSELDSQWGRTRAATEAGCGSQALS